MDKIVISPNEITEIKEVPEQPARIEPKLALLSLASGQKQREANEHDSGPHDWSVLNSLRTNPPIQLVEDGSSSVREGRSIKETIGVATAHPVDHRSRRRQAARSGLKRR